MDTGRGRFEILQIDDTREMERAKKAQDLESAKRAMEETYPEHGGWFRVGEEIEIRGSRFRVKSVKPNELRLKLLPK